MVMMFQWLLQEIPLGDMVGGADAQEPVESVRNILPGLACSTKPYTAEPQHLRMPHPHDLERRMELRRNRGRRYCQALPEPESECEHHAPVCG
jgi:hypothetical protein